MSPPPNLRTRVGIVLNMVLAFVVMILLGQLWLFTVALDAAASADKRSAIEITAVICSLLACAAVWWLIRFFAKMEKSQ